MAIREIVELGHPALARRADEIESITDEVRTLAKDMMETMIDAPGIGLAAPQVGVSLRLITLDLEDVSGALLNPVVVQRSEELETDTEACLSLPSIQGFVTRPAAVAVEGTTMDGDTVTIEADGLLARCLQHEIDHLDGKVFIDRVTDPKVKVFHLIDDPDSDEDEEVYESELVAVAEVRRRFEEQHEARASAAIG